MEVNMIYLQNEDLSSLISQGECLVDFYAEWCGPCKMLEPVLEEVQNDIKVIKVNIDMHNDLAAKYSIMSIPTLVYFKNGVEVKRTLGFQSKDMILENIQSLK